MLRNFRHLTIIIQTDLSVEREEKRYLQKLVENFKGQADLRAREKTELPKKGASVYSQIESVEVYPKCKCTEISGNGQTIIQFVILENYFRVKKVKYWLENFDSVGLLG